MGMLSLPTLTASCSGEQPAAGTEGAHPAALGVLVRSQQSPGIPAPATTAWGQPPGHPASDGNPGLAWELCALIQGQGVYLSFCYLLSDPPRARAAAAAEPKPGSNGFVPGMNVEPHAAITSPHPCEPSSPAASPSAPPPPKN